MSELAPAVVVVEPITPTVCRIGAGLLAARPRTRRPFIVALSIGIHVAVLMALSSLGPPRPRASTITTEKAVLVRLPRAFSRPAPVAARTNPKPLARRRPQRPVVVPPAPTPIVQPTPLPEVAPPEPAPVAETAPEESPATDMGTEAPSGEGPATQAPAKGVVGGTGTALELGQVAQPPVLLSQERPEYPRTARFDRVEGRVLLRAVIGVDGRIEPDEIRVLRSVPALDAAAIAALRAWRFSPGRDATGKPVRVLIEIPFEFSLR